MTRDDVTAHDVTTHAQFSGQIRNLARAVEELRHAGGVVLDRWYECDDSLDNMLGEIYPSGFSLSFDEWVSQLADWAQDIRSIKIKLDI